ncbi:MAG: lipopolysaccharide biosynthesis protein, partial [Eubacterium sp.]|nr:lipopolysaccharide biosynthesis protein [Eubacterium sp.]
GSVDRIYLIFFIYIVNSASSYLLIYRKTLIDAHQKVYITSSYTLGALVIQYILQVALLLIRPAFIPYLLIGLAVTVLKNVLLSRRALKMYPYLADGDVTPLSKEDRGAIMKNVRAMMYHKVGTILVNNTDNIILSAFKGLAVVGCYSNYYLLIGSVRQVLDRAFDGIAASVGNAGVTEDKSHTRTIFNLTVFVAFWLYGFSFICLYQLLSPFVGFSFGENYVFTRPVVAILCLNFLIRGLRKPALVFHDSLGLFWYDRYKPVAETAVNLVASLILVNIWGTFGVFVGTFISYMTTDFWVEPYVVCRYGLSGGVGDYFRRYGLYSLAVFLAFGVTEALCALVPSGGFVFEFCTRLPIVAVVPNVIFLICFFKTQDFQMVWRRIVRPLLRTLTRRGAKK